MSVDANATAGTDWVYPVNDRSPNWPHDVSVLEFFGGAREPGMHALALPLAYKRMLPGDRIWFRAANPIGALVGVGRTVTELNPDSDGAVVGIEYEDALCRRLATAPLSDVLEKAVQTPRRLTPGEVARLRRRIARASSLPMASVRSTGEGLARILSAAIEAAERRGVRRPRLSDLNDADAETLVLETLAFLHTRRAQSSPNPGWTQVNSFDAAVLRFWIEDHLGGPFPSATSARLQALRRDVYDRLHDLDRIIKEPGQTSPVHLAPLTSDLSKSIENDVHVAEVGAFFGDPETNKIVERAAMEATVAHFDGWRASDVSAEKCGWDITFERGQEIVHAEVKGVSGNRPLILLTRNEYIVATEDPHWRLCVVTRALVDPVVHEYERESVVNAASPYVYRVVLA